MNCPNCGQVLATGVRFCPSCGAAADAGQATRISDPAQTIAVGSETLAASESLAQPASNVVHGGPPCRSCGAATVPGQPNCPFCDAPVSGGGNTAAAARGGVNKLLIGGGIAAVVAVVALLAGFCVASGSGDDDEAEVPAAPSAEASLTQGSLSGAAGSPGASPSASASATGSPSPSASADGSASATATRTPTPTATRQGGSSQPQPPTATRTPTPDDDESATATNSATATSTATNTPTATNTATPTITPTPTITNTPTPTSAPVVLELQISTAKTFYEVGEAMEVCWDTSPDTMAFTITISHQSIRTVATLSGQVDGGCHSYELLKDDAGNITIIVQAKAPSGTTLTASVNATVR